MKTSAITQYIVGQRQSKSLVAPVKDVSKEETSINAQLLIRGGFVRKLMAGVYTFLPNGLRVLSQIERIVREEIMAFGSEEMLMPALMPAEPWQQTGRWQDMDDILFKMVGASGRELTLGPTHEEVITPLVSQFVSSYRDLPRSVFQIQTKYRNELRAKSGVLRGREFRMKDMYSFHASEADLEQYYERVKPVYSRIFARAGIGSETYMTYASGGAFSKFSHEYQMCTESGEDEISVCTRCEVALNKEVYEEFDKQCPECGTSDLINKKAIEVGNIFKLGTKFSKTFGLTYQDESGAQQDEIFTGCYGIGTSRLMGAIVELSHDERGIIWPQEVAPFQVHLVSLAKSPADVEKLDAVYEAFCQAGIEILYDDRSNVSAGAKFAESDLIGIPYRLTAGAKSLKNDELEFALRCESDNKHVVKLAALLENPASILK